MFLVFAKEPEYVFNHLQYEEAKKRQRHSDICWPFTKIRFNMATMFF